MIKTKTMTANSTEYNCKETKRVTIIGMLVNIVLTIFKIIVGLLANSSSVVADGVHSLSDVSTDVAILVGVKYWNEPPDAEHPYGHRRIETMTSVFIGLALLTASVFLGYGAIIKLQGGAFVVPDSIALVAAIISIILKEWLFHWTYKTGKKIKSQAVIANAWHHRSDCFSSIPVAISIALATYNREWAFLDPVATLAVCAFIVQAAYQILTPALLELSDRGADKAVLKQIEATVLEVAGVKSVHAVRSRYHGNELYVDLHIQVDGELSVREGHNISGAAKARLIEKGPDIVDVLVHVEPYEGLDKK
jgi:cation diffusion facilitator family transporter